MHGKKRDPTVKNVAPAVPHGAAMLPRGSEYDAFGGVQMKVEPVTV